MNEIDLPSESSTSPTLDEIESVACPERGDEDRAERDEYIIAFFDRAFHILNAYQSHQRGERALRMSLAAMEMALGFNLAAGADGPAELARLHGVSKQSLGKCLNHFVELLRLEPLPCQRKADGRERMRQARVRQLKAK